MAIVHSGSETTRKKNVNKRFSQLVLWVIFTTHVMS